MRKKKELKQKQNCQCKFFLGGPCKLEDKGSIKWRNQDRICENNREEYQPYDWEKEEEKVSKALAKDSYNLDSWAG